MFLLSGPAGSGKTARVLEEFRAALGDRHQSPRLLVPTATLSEHLQHELARDGVVLRARSVSTLARFVAELLPDVTVVDPRFFALLVEDAVSRLDLPEFARVRDLPGFHSKLATTLSDLDSAGVTPSQLRHLPESLAPFRAPVLAIWEDVNTRMRERGWVTRGTQLRMLASRLDGLALPDHIWIDGFATLSAPEIELICALGKRRPLTLTLPDEGFDRELRDTLLARGFLEEQLSGRRQPKEIVVVPETIEREVEEIARRIITTHREAGTPFGEIGVIVRQIEKYEHLLRTAFERFGIPVHFYFGRPLAADAASRSLMGVVDALLGGWEHAQVLDALRSMPVVGSSDELDALEIKLRKALPGSGLEALRNMAKARKITRVLQFLQGLEKWSTERLPADEWAERLETLPAIIWPGYLSDHVSREEVAQYRSAAASLKVFTRAVRDSSQWWTNRDPLSLADFWRVAKSVVRLTSVNTPNRARDVVHVISAYEARQWDLLAVFVCGLVEKEFPAQHGRDPFFSDTALHALARYGPAARTASSKDVEEFGLFEAVRTRARGSLVLSYPRANSRGQPVLPSIFLQNAPAPEPAVPVRPALPAAIAQWTAPSRIQTPDLLGVLNTVPATVSVSALEKLLQCPFQFFAHKSLRVREMPESPEDRLSFLLQGNIVHAVLHEWMSDPGPLATTFHRVFDRICREKGVQPGFHTERLRRMMLIAVERFARDTRYSASRRAQTEQPFELPLDSGITIKGVLDRIDLLEDGRAVVVDYKFSAANNVKDKVEDETKLQGPLYSLAVERVFGHRLAAMLYVGLKGDKVQYVGWGNIPSFPIELNPITPEWIPGAVDCVAEALTNYRSGGIQPRPLEQDACRNCTFRDGCRVEEQPLAIPAAGL